MIVSVRRSVSTTCTKPSGVTGHKCIHSKHSASLFNLHSFLLINHLHLLLSSSLGVLSAAQVAFQVVLVVGKKVCPFTIRPQHTCTAGCSQRSVSAVGRPTQANPCTGAGRAAHTHNFDLSRLRQIMTGWNCAGNFVFTGKRDFLLSFAVVTVLYRLYKFIMQEIVKSWLLCHCCTGQCCFR